MLPSIGAAMFFVVALFTFISVFLWWVVAYASHCQEIGLLQALDREAADIEKIIISDNHAKYFHGNS